MGAIRRDVLVGAVGALVALCLLGGGRLILSTNGIGFPDGSFQTSAALTDARRGYYLTSATYAGGGALAACAEGYHFASIWEIVDPAVLRYAFDVPGAAPPGPTGYGKPDGSGWVRTGDDSQTTKMVGSNCANWTSISSAAWGTHGRLPGDLVPNLSTTFVVGFGYWEVSPQRCDLAQQVWCMQD